MRKIQKQEEERESEKDSVCDEEREFFPTTWSRQLNVFL